MFEIMEWSKTLKKKKKKLEKAEEKLPDHGKISTLIWK